MDAEGEWDEKLKPCPFCGAPSELQTVPDGHPDSGAMFCQCSGNGCPASSALILPLMDDATDLVRERWNRREDDKYRKALAGLPDGAIDGGWTAAGMSAYAKKLEDALNSIIQYGTDTLSGRTDGPDDREWQRGTVLEMTKRAKAAMRHNE